MEDSALVYVIRLRNSLCISLSENFMSYQQKYAGEVQRTSDR